MFRLDNFPGGGTIVPHNWLTVVLFALMASVAIFYVRKFVRKNAPFYARMNILVVGATIGLSFELAAFAYSKFTSLPVYAFALLSVVQLAALFFIGHPPDSVDWTKKSRQTSNVAIVCSALVSVLFYLAY